MESLIITLIMVCLGVGVLIWLIGLLPDLIPATAKKLLIALVVVLAIFYVLKVLPF